MSSMKGWKLSMYHSEEELARLIAYIDDGEERIKDAKRIVVENTTDFDTWYKYSIPEERCSYPSVLGINTLIGNLVNEKLPWLKEEFKGINLDLDFLLETLEVLFDEGELAIEEVNNIKREFVKLNFGSMKNIW